MSEGHVGNRPVFYLHQPATHVAQNARSVEMFQTEQPTVDITNHILQLRELTTKTKEANEKLNRVLHLLDTRKQHINLFRNLAVQLQQHLIHPRERNVPILIRAIEHALNTTETKGD
jgi:hypothetical protein